ncbi:MAG TPA: sensor histidine kinase [Methylothermaceae bacterium]|nr:sensor histidine kinase [Methylothermaceae bacterium]
MTIRRSLLFSYLSISLLVAVALTSLAFLYMRQVLLTNIENQLQLRAIRIMEQIDATLFERMANVATWSRLSVMQELRVRDIDKRLSQFLRDLHQGYPGVYGVLFATNEQGEILAASNPTLIGGHMKAIPAWHRVQIAGKTISLLPLKLPAAHCYFSVQLEDPGSGDRLGKLYAAFAWKEILRLLDFPDHESLIQGTALLVDDDKRIIAASGEPSSQQWIGQQLNSRWLSHASMLTSKSQTDIMSGPEMLTGVAASQGYHAFPGFGWQVVLLASADQAMAPLWRLWWNLLLFLLLALIGSLILSYWLASRIAQPLSALTLFARHYMQGKQSEPPAAEGSVETQELSRAFEQMIRHLEQSRKDLVRASKLAVIGEMAASMAHEVRTPLGILQSAAEMLQREPGLSPPGHEMTEFILSETDRLKSLVSTLLDCARPRPPQFCPASANLILTRVLDLLQGKLSYIQADVKQELHEDRTIECDPDQLVQVFFNLLINAVQHIPQKGRIVIHTESRGEFWHVWICDNGPGIPREWREQLFDPFFTRREGGIGLGLTVVQQIILAHHGGIEATDCDLGGACFHLWLPWRQINVIHEESSG